MTKTYYRITISIGFRYNNLKIESTRGHVLFNRSMDLK